MTDKDELQSLLTKFSAGKATASEAQRLSFLISEKTKADAQAEKQAKVAKILKMIAAEGLTLADIRPEPEVIFEWNGHQQMSGLRGKPAAWTKELKEKVSKVEALKLAKGEKGKKFVENLYK